ncbi:MAG: heavy metal-responsive transcriptional regulator [Sporichthyaceae bacterium]
MQIGSLAQAGGVSAKTIRFYEQRGLLPPPPRTEGGYRDYPLGAVQRLRFIRDAQAAGLRLSAIAGILDLRDSGQAPCDRVQVVIAEHLEQIEHRLADLRATRALLRELALRATDVDPSTCAEEEICTILARGAPESKGSVR